MPRIKVNTVELYYEQHGCGPETVVFAHGLFCSGRMFDRQVDALKDRYRCVVFDFRGHGQSEMTESGYDLDNISADIAALIEKLDCAPCHFVGLSMGGFIGMRLAIRHPRLLKSLVLLSTTADAELKINVLKYRLMNVVARWIGKKLVAVHIMPLMFGKKFLNDPDRAPLAEEWCQRMLENHRLGKGRATMGAIARNSVHDDLDRIDMPTLIIAGDQDIATTPAMAERIAMRIKGSRLHVISGAGHLSTVEEPDAVNAVMVDFLSAQACV